MKEFYQMSSKEALEQMNSSMNGVSKEEASSLLEKHGENVLQEGERKSLLMVFLEQFKDLLVIILMIAATISMISGNVESTVVIIIVIILNALLGTVQFAKAQKSLDSLKALSSPNAKVIRGGEKFEIPSKELVPGDILLLEAGDLVSADGRILNNYSLQVNESSLTGESLNVDKMDGIIHEDEPLADRINMVYSGSLVAYGRATVLVTGTGMNTEIGKIASLMNATKEKRTPLQISLDAFSKKLAMVIIVICIGVFFLSLYRDMEIIDSLMFAVALAVAAIPEALSSIVTIVQAIGTQKMASQNAIIKELKAVESLGSVAVICSDKTGTLTQNKMTVQDIYINDTVISAKELDTDKQLHNYLVYASILDNDSSITDGKPIGDPTEYCLIEMANIAGIDENVIRASMPRIEEIPFDSDRKLMSTKNNINGKITVLTKGALDVLLERSLYIAKDKEVCKMTEEEKEKIQNMNLEFSKRGLRVLAFAYKHVDEDYELTIENEKDYTFLGLISIIDPPREESALAVKDAKSAGIKTVMITGDHKITATAIATQIGIYEEGDISLTGAELDALNDSQLDEILEKVSVYARVSPENKIRIVDAWQRKGVSVAMTGDGVNDAPALKKADIGVAMGITGTEVSKDAASMILTDDNFATIIKAVANGRNVYRNIKNAIQFLLSGNTAGILVVLYTSLMALPVPFVPVHLLFINLLTDSLPALAIGMEPADKSLLKQPPRDPKAGLLTRAFLLKLLGQGGAIAIATIVAYHIGLEKSPETASTMAFTVLTMSRLFHGFNCRSQKPILKIGLRSNLWSVGAFFTGVVLLNLVLYVPFLQRVFEVVNLDRTGIMLIYGLAFLPTVVIQIYKTIANVITSKAKAA